MTLNMGSADRILRVIAGVALLALAFLFVQSTVLTIVLGVVAAVLVITGVVGFCPAYLPFRISTRSKDAA